MKLKKFEVVELIDGNKATVLDIRNNEYYAEIVDSKGNTIGYKNITEANIKNILVSKD